MPKNSPKYLDKLKECKNISHIFIDNLKGRIYNIAEDDQQLRACVQAAKVEQKAFDLLRKNYPLRREWATHGGPKA